MLVSVAERASVSVRLLLVYQVQPFRLRVRTGYQFYLTLFYDSVLSIASPRTYSFRRIYIAPVNLMVEAAGTAPASEDHCPRFNGYSSNYITRIFRNQVGFCRLLASGRPHVLPRCP